MKDVLKFLKSEWVIVSFILSITSFLLGWLYNNIRYSYFEFDYFLFYDLGDYLKIAVQSLLFWTVVLLVISIAIAALIDGVKKLKQSHSEAHKKRFGGVRAKFKTAAFILIYILAVVVAYLSLTEHAESKFTLADQGLTGLYNIKRRSTEKPLDCVSLIDTNAEYVFVWDHLKKRVNVIPKSNIGMISAIHRAMPSRGILDRLSGGGNGGGHEPPTSNEELSRLNQRLANEAITPRERYDKRLTDWFESVERACPNRVKASDIDKKKYNHLS